MGKISRLLIELNPQTLKIVAIRGLVVLASTISLFFIAFLFDPREFGYYVFARSVGVTLIPVLSLGAANYLLRIWSKGGVSDEWRLSKSYLIKLTIYFPVLVALVLFVVHYIYYEYGGLRNSHNYLNSYLFAALLSNSLVASTFNVMASWLRVQGFIQLAMLIKDASQSIIIVIAALILYIFNNLNILNLVLLHTFIASLMMLFLSIKYVALRVILRFENEDRRQNEKTPLPFSYWINGTVTSFGSNADTILGSYFLTPENLGAYQLVKRIAGLILTSQIVVNWIHVVKIAQLFIRGEKVKLQAHLFSCAYISTKLALIFAFACLPLYFLLGIFQLYVVNNDVFCAYLLISFSMVFVASNGLNFSFASQTGFEKYSLLSRFLGLLSIVGMTSSYDGNSVSYLALTFVSSAVVSNSFLSFILWQKVGVNTTIFNKSQRAVT